MHANMFCLVEYLQSIGRGHHHPFVAYQEIKTLIECSIGNIFFWAQRIITLTCSDLKSSAGITVK